MTAASRPLKGMVLVALATLTFAVGDVLTKYLSESHSVTLLMAARYLVNLVLVTAIMLPQVGRDLWRTERTWLVLMRGASLAIGSFTMGLALKVMPVGETVAIIYLAPFVVLLLSPVVLKESVGLAGWCLAAMGFVGVLLIVRPGSGLDPWGMMMALINVGFGAAYYLLTRLLSRSETTVAMLWHTALVGTVGFGAAYVMSPQENVTTPVLMQLGLLGILATLGHFLFTAAYREAPAGQLAPIGYLHLVWAAGLGWVVFDHLPDVFAIIGMVAIVLAGALSAGRKNA